MGCPYDLIFNGKSISCDYSLKGQMNEGKSMEQSNWTVKGDSSSISSLLSHSVAHKHVAFANLKYKSYVTPKDEAKVKTDDVGHILLTYRKRARSVAVYGFMIGCSVFCP
ncbi:hypothetical protein ZEAMMB73_Zm00001d002583 [Zea mays]|uniref:Uncharacterized protein n=1 Tax=Zea mays TaxID=4577 RepID=A0A1D6E218_MAIZE|nr:hypothetical protein ZEAMMB73_Zm00001d002583 [Zea mays]